MPELVLTFEERQEALKNGNMRDFIKQKLEAAGFSLNKSFTVKQRLEDNAIVYSQK